MEKNHYPDKIEAVFEFKITKGQSADRIDIFLTRTMAGATRNKVQMAIEAGNCIVNGKVITKASKKIQPGDMVICKVLTAPPIELIPENIPIDVVFEDEYLLVVNKPAGMCVHPGVGNRYGTLINALLFHLGHRDSIIVHSEDDDDEYDFDEAGLFASDEVRPGLVHRIDKDTSGLLVVAKDRFTHNELSKQFAEKTTQREYNALVWGKFKEHEGEIIGNIDRSTRDRKMFVVSEITGKYAKTDYFVIEEFSYTSLLKFKLHTGRTHQIRVHTSHLHRPIFGDALYGGDKVVFGGEEPKFRKIALRCLDGLNRQLLHAKTLGFIHPHKKEFMQFDSIIPIEFSNVLDLMREYENNK